MVLLKGQRSVQRMAQPMDERWESLTALRWEEKTGCLKVAHSVLRKDFRWVGSMESYLVMCLEQLTESRWAIRSASPTVDDSVLRMGLVMGLVTGLHSASDLVVLKE
jgi:hypothetical protein